MRSYIIIGTYSIEYLYYPNTTQKDIPYSTRIFSNKIRTAEDIRDAGRSAISNLDQLINWSGKNGKVKFDITNIIEVSKKVRSSTVQDVTIYNEADFGESPEETLLQLIQKAKQYGWEDTRHYEDYLKLHIESEKHTSHPYSTNSNTLRLGRGLSESFSLNDLILELPGDRMEFIQALINNIHATKIWWRTTISTKIVSITDDNRERVIRNLLREIRQEYSHTHDSEKLEYITKVFTPLLDIID